MFRNFGPEQEQSRSKQFVWTAFLEVAPLVSKNVRSLSSLLTKSVLTGEDYDTIEHLIPGCTSTIELTQQREAIRITTSSNPNVARFELKLIPDSQRPHITEFFFTYRESTQMGKRALIYTFSLDYRGDKLLYSTGGENLRPLNNQRDLRTFSSYIQPTLRSDR